jgi:hypothetical protein
MIGTTVPELKLSIPPFEPNGDPAIFNDYRGHPLTIAKFQKFRYFVPLFRDVYLNVRNFITSVLHFGGGRVGAVRVSIDDYP